MTDAELTAALALAKIYAAKKPLQITMSTGETFTIAMDLDLMAFARALLSEHERVEALEKRVKELEGQLAEVDAAWWRLNKWYGSFRAPTHEQWERDAIARHRQRQEGK